MNRYLALIKTIELGSFTKAGEALGYTQSGISQMIQSLENELKTTLLIRSRGGIQLTSEGDQLLPHIQNLCHCHRVLSEKVQELHGLESGIIRIGTYSSVSCHWLPTLMKGFNQKYPCIKFELYQGDYTSIKNWIMDGKVDFGFINPVGISHFETISLKGDRMLAIMPENCPLADYQAIPIERLVKEPFILLEEGDTNEVLLKFQENGLQPNICFRAHDDYSIMSMVENGLGVSILPELVLNRTAYHIAVREINPPVSRMIGIAFKDKKSLPLAVKYFIDYIVAEINHGSLDHIPANK